MLDVLYAIQSQHPFGTLPVLAEMPVRETASFSEEIKESLYSFTVWCPVINHNQNPSGREKKQLNIEFFFSNPEPKNKTFLKCKAKNYSGHFTCWWLTAISTDLKFSVKSSRG